MNQVKEKYNVQQIEKEHLVALYQLMIENQDFKNAKKIVELYEKQNKEELMVSFAGHFSAGKSSMINSLLGEEILPKSPIPTSANLVKINSGDGTARVFLANGEIIEFKEPYDMDQMKEYSKDKDTIKRIHISTAKSIVPKGTAIMDTPGIDAADDADRLMTEGSLHLVDVLFYVMDYNHVQSEVNLQFLRSIQEKSIPYFIIVNQIDKHDEKELPFNQFDLSIRYTFEQWDLKPDGIYFSSLKDMNAKHNQFPQIKEKMDTIMKHKDNYVNIDASVVQVVEAHKKYLKSNYEDKVTEMSIDEDEMRERLEELEKVSAELHNLEQEPDQFMKEFNHEWQKTLNNAYLMPATLRDKAKLYLESTQDKFKVGLFASKKKTNEEKERRVSQFLTSLQDSIEASVSWKLREKLVKIVKDYDISDEKIYEGLQRLSVSFDQDDLQQLLNPGAKLNGDYVLNYTNEVANEVKNKFKKKMVDLQNQANESLRDQNYFKIKDYEEKKSDLHQVKDVKESHEKLEKELIEKYEVLEQQLKSPSPSDNGWKRIQETLDNQLKGIQQSNGTLDIKGKQPAIKKAEKKENIPQSKNTYTTNDVLESIDSTIEAITELPGFEGLIGDLKQKHQRLEERSYTIALFGAFSAGKSSFANALIGENALPVSPNPTTAAVNRIRPVSAQYKHGTVVVTIKDEKTLSNDLLQITNRYSPKGSNYAEILKWVEDNQIQQHEGLNKMYQAFLQALINGFKENKDRIGKQVTIDLESFATYVTDESKACYIEAIDVYYDCSLTRQGITLVDTPGADSVNARHTNVAFDYIKHADAILYVTYYNHALSRADRDFLMQLGRVKEAFQLDKMFFIVNAADLAQDENELNMVVEYVEDQLLELGVRLPKLYPVSSKRSLEEKVSGSSLNEKMKYFEERFYHFIHHDLTHLTVESACWDIHRTYHAITEYIDSLNLDETEKENRKQDLINKKEELIKEVEHFDSTIYDNRIHDKMDKQLYYVIERLSIRFHDMFKEHFNPTTVTESGRKGQAQLRISLENLIDYVGNEIKQELQAVSLRLEAYIHEQGAEIYQQLKDDSRKKDKLYELANWDGFNFETPNYQKAFGQLNLKVFDKALSSFKGTKAFFEKNEKEQMKEKLHEILLPFAKEYVDENKVVMEQHYRMEWNDLVKAMKQEAVTSVNNHLENFIEMMTGSIDINLLMEKQALIQEIKHELQIEEV